MLAALLAHMKPPYDLPEPVSEETPGYYELEVPVLSPGSRPSAISSSFRRTTIPTAATR